MGPQHHLTLKISWKRNLYILKFVGNQEKMIRNIAPILMIKWYMVTIGNYAERAESVAIFSSAIENPPDAKVAILTE